MKIRKIVQTKNMIFLFRSRGDSAYDYEPSPPSSFYDSDYTNDDDDTSDDITPSNENLYGNTDSDGFFTSNEGFTSDENSISDSVGLSDDVILNVLGSDSDLIHKLEVTVNVLGKKSEDVFMT